MRKLVITAAGVLLTLLLAVFLTACGGGGTSEPDTNWPGLPGSAEFVNYPAAAKAVLRLNEFRAKAGQAEVRLSYDLCVNAQKHAAYLYTNSISLQQIGLAAHNEDPNLPGYSLAGDLAGSASVIYQGVGPVEAIDNWMQTLYHRLGLMDPNMYTIGFGSKGNYQVMDIHHGRVTGVQARPAVAMFPAPGMGGVPVSYIREIPHPIVGDDSLGIPITIEFSGLIGLNILGVEAILQDMTTRELVEIYVQSPSHPFRSEYDIQQVIAIIPKDPLNNTTTYKATVLCFVDGEPWSASWTFTTE